MILLAGLILALLLCGCEPQLPPETEPTITPTTEPTTEPTTAPTEPPILTGWQEVDGVRYFYDENGEPYLGWLVTAEGTFYLNADGSAQTGWTDMGDHTYRFRQDGTLVTGWHDENGSRYYFAEGGAMAQGWQTIDGNRYYFTGEGAMYTGWLYRGEYAYYLHADGKAAVGPTEIDGETRYFGPTGIHVLLVNPWNMLPEDYETDLSVFEGDLSVATACFDALTQMFADCRAAGCDPVLISGYRTWGTQEWLYTNELNEWLSWGYDLESARKYAGREVAVPGTSEHQLGLAVDIVDNNNWSLTEVQETTRTQKWIMEHCWEYGFILRYPNGTTDITGIIYEPWHYRYVGVEVAMELKAMGITLEEYLGAA